MNTQKNYIFLTLLFFFFFQIEFISVQFICIVIFTSDIQPYMYLHKFTKRRTKIKFELHLANWIFQYFIFQLPANFQRPLVRICWNSYRGQHVSTLLRAKFISRIKNNIRFFIALFEDTSIIAERTRFRSIAMTKRKK